MIVLGLDPSLAAFGLALVDVDARKLLASAVLETSAKTPRHKRLGIIHRAIVSRVARWMDSTAIDMAAFEAGFAFAGRGRSTDLGIAEARGAGYVAVAILDAVTLTPAECRKAVVGSGAAKKEHVVVAVRRILSIEGVLDHNVADAAAVALAAGGYSAPPITIPRAAKKPGGQRVATLPRRRSAGTIDHQQAAAKL